LSEIAGFQSIFARSASAVTPSKQVAQLSQKDRAAGWVNLVMPKSARLELGDNILGTL